MCSSSRRFQCCQGGACSELWQITAEKLRPQAIQTQLTASTHSGRDFLKADLGSLIIKVWIHTQERSLSPSGFGLQLMNRGASVSVVLGLVTELCVQAGFIVQELQSRQEEGEGRDAETTQILLKCISVFIKSVSFCISCFWPLAGIPSAKPKKH